jgi:hypothetical protein
VSDEMSVLLLEVIMRAALLFSVILLCSAGEEAIQTFATKPMVEILDKSVAPMVFGALCIFFIMDILELVNTFGKR